MDSKLKSLLPFKNKLYSLHKNESIQNQIMNVLKDIPTENIQKLDNELILYVCNLVELFCHSKKMNLDKLELLLSVFKKLYETITDEEISHIKNTVEFFVVE